jgi:glycosyltransferase 2 family protein
MRIAGSFLCFAYIAWKMEFDKTVELVANPHWPFLWLCVALTPPLILTSVWRWLILLRARGVDTPFGLLLRIYVIGTFFNQIAPSTIGGDVYRVHGGGRHSIPTHVAAASVFVDRIIGLSATVFALVLSWLFVAFWTGEFRWLVVAGALTLVLGATLWWVVVVKTESLYQSRSGRTRGKLLAGMAKWHAAVQEYRKHPASLAAAIALSGLFLVLSGLNFWFAAMAFQTDVEMGRVFLIVPSILTLGSLPVSVGGWGLQELSAAVVFDSAGFAASLGLSAALLIRGKNVLLAIVGGCLYLLPWKAR